MSFHTDVFAAAVETAPAAGAEVRQIMIGTIVISIWMGAVVALGLAHRAGRTQLLARAGAGLERRTKIPGWAMLPYLVAVTALAIAGVGFVWDVALHLDAGRDAGPFANPSHYMLIVGTVGFVTAGWLACVMPLAREAGPSAVRIADNWYAPAAGISMIACALFSISGFVADDVWHRLFGQDVTLWGPTHLMMITGGLLVLFSSFMLMREAMRTKRSPRSREERETGFGKKGPVAILSTALLLGGALAGMTIAYQQEFSYGFPQFRLLFHPVLIAFSAGVVLTVARTMYGRGGALIACGGALLLNALLSFTVVYGFGELTLHFPLYIAAAIWVELAAGFTADRGRYVFALVAAAGIGVFGTLGEALWSNVWMPLPWPAHIVPSAVTLSVVAAACGSVLGTFFGTTMTAQDGSRLLGSRVAGPPVVAIAVFTVMVIALIPANAPADVTASVKLTETSPGFVNAEIRYSDPTFADNADWAVGMAWQGDAKAIVEPLAAVSPGVWRTTEPLPVDGTWKTAIRVHRGSMLASVPVYMPADEALKLPALTATPEFTRSVVMDRKMMQRERKSDVPGWLFAVGAGVVGAATIGLLLLFGWALLRVARGGRPAAVGVIAASAHDAGATSTA